MELIFATHNLNKVDELRHKLEGTFSILSLHDLKLTEDIPETGDTLEENALIKANYVFKKTNKPCFADDTGLEVDALEGAPGVHTARFAGEHATIEENINKLMGSMNDVEKRNACFRTVIAYVDENANEYLFKGSIKGYIPEAPRGEEGFGYDPVFVPEGFDKTFAELSKAEKNAISHRGRAVVKFVKFLRERAEEF